jgi:mRNA-degrading endonuclease HigB of HigAB toxin-antitoxin module
MPACVATIAWCSILLATSTRLVVEMQYQAGIAWVKFAGTHAQYDRIDVETVNDY